MVDGHAPCWCGVVVRPSCHQSVGGNSPIDPPPHLLNELGPALSNAWSMVMPHVGVVVVKPLCHQFVGNFPMGPSALSNASSSASLEPLRRPGNKKRNTTAPITNEFLPRARCAIPPLWSHSCRKSLMSWLALLCRDSSLSHQDSPMNALCSFGVLMRIPTIPNIRGFKINPSSIDY